jgi:membrane-associated phospholipid phosphatase
MTRLKWRAAAFVAACAATALAFPADETVSRWFAAHRRDGLDPAALAATTAWTLGAFVWVTCATLAWRGRARAALLVAGTTAVTLAIGSAIKVAVGRPRPYQALADFVALTVAHDASFPSNHTNASFAAAIVLSAVKPRLWPVFFSFATAIALTRLYVGVHFLSDVCGGIALALLTSTVALAWAERRGWLKGKAEPRTEGAVEPRS